MTVYGRGTDVEDEHGVVVYSDYNDKISVKIVGIINTSVPTVIFEASNHK